MDRRTLGKTGFSVSIIPFSGITVDNVDKEKAKELVELAIKNDINYFDVAPNYGNAQYMLGPALEPYRKDVYLTCKTTDRSAYGSKKQLLESLSALKTDYLDVYQFHSVSDLNEVEQIFSPGGAMETFKWAYSEGLVRHIGFTSHFDSVAMELFSRFDFETMLFPVNYSYRINRNASVEPLDYCIKNNIGVIAIKSLAERSWRPGEEVTYPRCWYRPIYDNPELARIALNYTLTRPGVTTAPPPGDERMFKVVLDIMKSQNGSPVEPTAEEYEYLRKYAVSMAEEVIF